MTSTDARDTELTDLQRNTLRTLALRMLPGTNTLPSASMADVAGKGVDRVLTARPDLRTSLSSALTSLESETIGADLTPLIGEDAQRWDVLAFVVTGAYYTDSSVKAAIGYPGQVAKTLNGDDFVDLVNSGVLEPVINRGPIYRAVEGVAQQQPDDGNEREGITTW